MLAQNISHAARGFWLFSFPTWATVTPAVMSFPRADSKVDPAHGLGPVLESTAIEDHGSPTWLSVRPGRAFGLALRDWAWELAGTVAAGLMLVAIGISMYKYDKTKQSDWAINLTTLVAIISTFLRATLVFIVTSSTYGRIYPCPGAQLRLLMLVLLYPQYSASWPGTGLTNLIPLTTSIASTPLLEAG